MSMEKPPEPLDFFIWSVEDVVLWLEEINLGGYRQIFNENDINGESLEGMSMFTTEQILRFIRRRHMKWGDFITLCKELHRIKGGAEGAATMVGLLASSRLYFLKQNRQSQVVSLKLER